MLPINSTRKGHWWDSCFGGGLGHGLSPHAERISEDEDIDSFRCPPMYGENNETKNSDLGRLADTTSLDLLDIDLKSDVGALGDGRRRAP